MSANSIDPLVPASSDGAKKNGDWRPITSFNWVDHARQLVLKSALTPFASLHDRQFMLSHDKSRRGPAAVREALLDALNSCSEDSIFIQFDVVDFFGSISHDWLESNLGIDPSIIARHLHLGGIVVDTSAIRPDVHARHEANKAKGRWGIPQGSAVSSLVAEQVLASVLRSAAVFEALPLVTWSDNLGIIVSRERARETVELVWAAFAAHGAGPFQLTVRQTAVSSEFKFLGTWYRKDGAAAIAFIPDEVISTWEASIFDRVLVCGDSSTLNDIVQHVNSKIAQWRWFEAGIQPVEMRLRRALRSTQARLFARD